MNVLATEYLNIDDISDYTNDDYFLPTLGPCNIDFYTEPHNFRINKNKLVRSNGLNNSVDNVNEEQQTDGQKVKFTQRTYIPIYGDAHSGGGDYVARLFLCVKSFKHLRNSSVQKHEEEMKQLEKTKENLRENVKNFLLFAIINEATIIDPRYSNSQLSFRLCLGTNGYELPT